MSNAPLVLASDLQGRAVVAIDAGDDIAEVRDIVFDPVSQALVGVTLNKRGWFRGRLKETLPVGSISAIGPAAIMTPSAQDLVDKADAPAPLEKPGEGVSVIGTRVLSEAGDDLGVIDDVVLETDSTPHAVGYRVDGANGQVFVPIDVQVALSGENLLLPAEATDFIRSDLSGFGAAVANHRSQLDTTSAGSNQ